MVKSILRIIWKEVTKVLEDVFPIVSYCVLSILIGSIIVLPIATRPLVGSEIGFALIAGTLIGTLSAAYIYGGIYHLLDAIKYSKEHYIKLEEAWKKTRQTDDWEP